MWTQLLQQDGLRSSAAAADDQSSKTRHQVIVLLQPSSSLFASHTKKPENSFLRQRVSLASPATHWYSCFS
jgi:hypothetical protein